MRLLLIALPAFAMTPPPKPPEPQKPLKVSLDEGRQQTELEEDFKAVRIKDLKARASTEHCVDVESLQVCKSAQDFAKGKTWCEGGKPAGPGELITVYLPAERELVAIDFRSFDPSSKEALFAHPRVKALSLETAGKSYRVDYKDHAKADAFQPGAQAAYRHEAIIFPHNKIPTVKTKYFRLKILETYPGEVDKPLCLSQLSVWARPLPK